MNNHVATVAPTGARLRLVALVRISKDRDNETSTQTQPFEINAWADTHGMEIVHTFTEVARSGFKRIPRPYLEDALAMVRNGLADGIIVWKVDRFTRKGAIEIFRMLASIADGNGFLIASNDGIDTRSGGMADVIKLTVIAELAKAESEAKSDRSASWHRGRLRGDGNNGKPLPPAGRRPFGYDRRNGKLSINATEAATVRTIADDFLGGKSMRAIVRDLNASGIRKDDERPWSHRGVAYILASPTIAGGRMIDGTFIAGDWKAILDVATWQAVAAKLRDPSRRTAHTNEPQWLLTGIARCGRDGCDGSIRAKRHPKTGYRYTCKVCGCSVVASVADAVATETVMDYLAGDGWRALRASGRTHDASAIAFLTARLDHARNRWMDGKDSDAEYDRTKDEINARLAAIKSAPVVELPDVDDIASAWPTLPLESKRQVITAATESIRIMPSTPGASQFDRVVVI